MNSKKTILALSVLGVLTPLFAFAAPTLSGIPDPLKNTLVIDGTINDVVSDGAYVYIGGSFSTVNGETRNNVAALDISDYSLAAFDPNVNGEVHALALSLDESKLYVGGNFTQVNGGTTRINLAGFATTTGSVDVDFDADLVSGIVYELFIPEPLGVDEFLYVGGDYFERSLGDTFDGVFSMGTLGGASPQALEVVLSDGGSGNLKVKAFEATADGSTLYVGGDLTDATYTVLAGEGAPFDETTFLPATFPEVTTGGGGGGATIYAAVPDGSGGWFIGGTFDTVDGDPSYSGVAHIDSTGTVDESFQPAVTFAGDPGTVYALAHDATSSLLYIAGKFDSVNAIAHEGVVALSTVDGSVDATFDPSVTLFDIQGLSEVFDIELSPDGNTLYIAGNFDEINTVTRYNLGAIDTATGDEAAFVLDGITLDTLGNVNEVELSSDGSTLYAGGEFFYCFTVTCTTGGVLGTDYTKYLIKADTAGSGTVASTTFRTIPDGSIQSMTLSPDDSLLYIGGSFTTIDYFPPGDPVSYSRTGLAELDASDGSVEALNIPMGAAGTLYADSMNISADGGTLYLGGAFTQVNSTSRPRFAAIDIGTNALTGFTYDFGDTVRVVSEPQDGEIFIGGSFTGLTDTATRPLVISVALGGGGTDTLNPFDANMTYVADATVVEDLLLSADEATLYIGGSFTEVDGTTRNGFAAVDATTGALDALDPELGEEGVVAYCPSGSPSVHALERTADDAVVYVGGCFNLVGVDASRNSLVGINTVGGSVNVFNPSLTGEGATAFVYGLALNDADTELYVGGSINSGTTESGIKLSVFSEGAEQPGEEDGGGDGDGGGGEDEEEDDGGGGGSSSRRDSSSSSSSGGGSQTNILFVLLSRLQELLRQIIALGGTVPPEALQYLNMSLSGEYTRDLTLGDRGLDVTALQNFLITQNKGPAAQALAAVGATGYFGLLTQAALAEFQAAVGIVPAVGYFGPITRMRAQGI